MGTLAHTSWLSQALRLVPARLHAALDGWSYRVARQHAARRRQDAQTEAAKAAEYKLRPWRD